MSSSAADTTSASLRSDALTGVQRDVIALSQFRRSVQTQTGLPQRDDPLGRFENEGGRVLPAVDKRPADGRSQRVVGHNAGPTTA